MVHTTKVKVDVSTSKLLEMEARGETNLEDRILELRAKRILYGGLWENNYGVVTFRNSIVQLPLFDNLKRNNFRCVDVL